MRFKLTLAVTILVVVLISSCKQNSVSLDFTNAKGEVPQLGNLVFRFSKPLVSDSLLNIWDSSDYVSFSPNIEGRFRWESPDQLVFSPRGPLDPATSYTAKVKKSVLHYTKFNQVEGGDKISFHTPELTLDNSQMIWMLEDETSRKAVPQVDLFFNYRVNPEELKKRLTVELDGAKADYSLITLSPENKISLRINGLNAEDKNYEARILIDKGLKPEVGSNGTEEEIRSKVFIPSPFVLTIQNIESEHDGMEGIVRVMTSQQLTGESLKSLIEINPTLAFNTELTDYGLRITSDKFDVEKSYTVRLLQGLRGKIGGVLKEDFDGSVAFGELEADISFTNSKAVYLSRKGSKNMEVRITNVSKVKLIISKIYESNLLMAHYYGYNPRTSSDYGYASYSDDYYEDYYDDYSGNVQMGDVIYSKEIDTRTLARSGNGRLLNLSEFEDRLPDFNGIYHISIRSTEDYWVRDNRFVSLSDLGLIAREGHDKFLVFVNSIKTSDAVSGVTVSLYASNNQLLGSGTSNSDGVAEIPYVKKEFSGFKPAMLIAKTAEDFNYLPFFNSKVNLSRFDVGGKRNNPSGLDAFIYAERDIYRPGEKINYAVVIRDRQWNSPGQIPMKMKFLLPNGKELKVFRKNLDEEGSLEGSIDISGAAITGSYSLELYTSNDVLLGSKSFSVEEFVPDRIRVDAKLDKESLKTGESAQLSITASNFFGPPAANRNYEMEVQVRQKYFSPEKFSDYNFSLANQRSFTDKDFRQGKTDASGKASESFEVKDIYENLGVLQAKFYTTVFDETGRPVSRSAELDIFTQEIFMGIKNDWNYYFPLNQVVKIPLAAVNKSGNPVNTKARVEVIKKEYHTSLVRSGSYFRYESSRNDRMMIENEISVGNGTVFSYVPRSPGDYEVRIYNPGSSNYVVRNFYSYGGWGGGMNSFEVNNEGNVEIELDKKSYTSGEKVTALFKTPFSGRMLVTVETDRVISYQYVNVDQRTASLDLKLGSEHVPNMYITATLIKPHEVSDIPLTVAHGFKNVKVEEKSRKIDVEIVAKKEVRSKTKQKVTVKADPGSFVTLAAVDNGVLQVSNFKTPDPYNYFYQKKALQVSSYDLYPLLFPEIRGRFSSTGGDGEAEMDKRVNPMPAKRIKIVSFWSGIQKANSRGEADFEFNIPQFSGEVRLMAVTYKGNSFGSSENTMTVADPIVISTALPRFLSPGDTVTVPVTLSNTTSKSASITAAISVNGPVKVVGGKDQSLTIPSKSESQTTFRVVADPSIDVAKISITVNGLGEKFSDVTDISVRPPSTLQKITGSGSIVGGKTEKINIITSDFMPASVDYSLVISRSPALEMGKHFRYLVQYPYGCTEQTVSAAFPQLYYGEMADLMQLHQQGKSNANSNIIEAIRKIKMRQLYNGAVTLWDGEGTEDWWTTVYAAHFLLEARKAGFDYDNSLVETMLSYLSNRLKTKETITYYYNRDQNKKIAPKEVAYSLYVLALAGKTNVPSMNYYKSNQQLLSLDSRYLISAAYATAGDKRSFNAMLPSSFSGEESVAQTGGSFYSDIRDEAIALNALIDVDPGNSQIGIMAKHVSDKLKSRTWLNTQERAFAFLALGKLAKSANQSDATAEIRVNGKLIAQVTGGKWTGDKNLLKGSAVDITVKGNGRLYYFWESEGISTSGSYNEVDNYLKVRKRFYDRFGNPINGNTFKQNDLIIVGITLERSFNTVVENVVITDLLPAGFEIENPRTKEIPGMDWIKDAASPTALDVRDDRIHFFVDARYNKQVYYYAVRAVSPGNFKMGPVSADAMYNGEYHSYHGAGMIRVLQ